MIRVGVIGVGAMGRNHARVLHDLANVELAGMADQDAATAQQVGAATGTRGYESYQELLERERPQAVVVAVPSDAHHPVVLDALAAGCHVLVEKPIAATVEQADDLVKAASKAKKVLAVGHIERYNPAVLELKRRRDSWGASFNCTRAGWVRSLTGCEMLAWWSTSPRTTLMSCAT